MVSGDVSLRDFCRSLGYTDSSTFYNLRSDSEIPRDISELQEDLDIDAVYVRESKNPGKDTYVYFKEVERPGQENIADIYSKVWNEGRAALLIVMSPSDIKVYNPKAAPIKDDNDSLDSSSRLIENIEITEDALEEIDELEIYRKENIDSSNFWESKRDEISNDGRVDKHLHDNLLTLKEILQKKGLGSSHANNLITKSIFVMFLQHRGIINSDFYEERDLGSGYKEVLSDQENVFELFDILKEKFNGDVFTYSQEEKKQVDENHLRCIKDFLEGKDLETGQTRLFPYSFDIIPVELISSIYEEFVPSGKGVYYTPNHLVNFLLSEIPDEKFSSDSKILDPACGSGVFLVNALERIIEQKDEEDLEAEELQSLLEDNIYGVDKSPEAVQITAFSLSLKMAEYLDTDLNEEGTKLPELVGNNLFESNFFSREAEFNDKEFDLIVGNPPWVQNSESEGAKYCERKGLPAGNGQLSIPFIWKSQRLASDNAEISLLVQTRDILLLERTKEFRDLFFEKADVKSITNLSILRKRLFENSDSPCSIIRFSPSESGENSRIRYVVPSYQPVDILQGIVVDSNEISYIPSSEINGKYWKVAMYGGIKDIEFIRRLDQIKTLEELVDKMDSWEMGVGSINTPGDKENNLHEYPHLPWYNFQNYWINSDAFESFEKKKVVRPRTEKNLWEGPKVIIRKGITTSKESKFNCSYTSETCTFSQFALGIRGDEENKEILKVLTLILNSKLTEYYLFMTSSKWGVERAETQRNEIKTIPCIIPDKDSDTFNELIELYEDAKDRIENSGEVAELKEKINQKVFDLYDLTEEERALVKDRTKNTINYYHGKEGSPPTQPPEVEDLEEYAGIIKRNFEGIIRDDREISYTLYTEERQGIEEKYKVPLNLVTFSITRDSNENQKEVEAGLKDSVERISRQVESNKSNLYVNRKEIYYIGNKLHLIKPNEIRFWDRASAYNDFNELLGDIIGK